jgi:flavin-dependent dehydrogenase
MVALQYEVVLFEPQFHADIFFHPDYEGGYGWFFPKGRTANVGIAIIPQKTARLPDFLNDFLNLLNRFGKLPRIEIVSRTGGSIPCETHRQTVFGNILLAGDAAGHAHPITGAGILNAVICGEMAGRIAAEAVARGDLNYLEHYETEWREMFGQTLSYGALKRKFLEEHWNRSGMDFKDLIRKTWVGFKEYHEDRRKIPLHL